MIPYSVNTGIREKITVILVLISMLITILLEMIVPDFGNFQSEILNSVSSLWAFKLLMEVALPPFIVWAMLNGLYSKKFWKFRLCQSLHNIPDLNGEWEGMIINDKKERKVSVKIEQDWNNIRIRTELVNTNNTSDVKSFCECKIAAIDIKCGEIKLKYVYKNGLLGDKSYIGYNELEVEENKIWGQYITSKPTNGVFDIKRV